MGLSINLNNLSSSLCIHLNASETKIISCDLDLTLWDAVIEEHVEITQDPKHIVCEDFGDNGQFTLKGNNALQVFNTGKEYVTLKDFKNAVEEFEAKDRKHENSWDMDHHFFEGVQLISNSPEPIYSIHWGS